jgi:DNA-binding LacI/PurR family transcriptional regulator
LLAGPDRPSAIVCTGDILALGLVAECRARALRIPEDVSVVGCGDTDMGHYVDPPLTTIRMPFVELGEAAATQLLAILAGGRPKNTLVTLAHEFVGRESVRRCSLPQAPTKRRRT